MTSDFFSKLDLDLRDLALREVAATKSRPKRRRRGRRHSAIATAAVLLIGGAVATATDLLPIGAKVPVRTIGGPHEPNRTGPRIAVATGRTPITGRWQMFWSRSSAGDCIALQFLDEPGPGAGSISEGCGGPQGLTVGARVPIPGTPNAETVIDGRTPDDVAAVRVTVPGLGDRVAAVRPGPQDVPGNWYVVPFAGIPSRGTVTVQGLDRNDKPLGPPAEFELTLHPRYPNPNARYVGAERLAVSRGGLVSVALACTRQAKRQGKCIGTITIKTTGTRVRCRRTASATACPDRGRRIGWQYYRLSPGTRRRNIHVRLSTALHARVDAEKTVRARLSVGGRKRDVVLIAS